MKLLTNKNEILTNELKLLNNKIDNYEDILNN